MSQVHERVWRCECGWGHFLTISGLDWEPGEQYLTLEGSFRATKLREKLRAAYEIFRRGHYDTWLEVQLDQETTREVRDQLTKLLEQ